MVSGTGLEVLLFLGFSGLGDWLGGVVSWLFKDPAICERFSGTALLTQLCMLPH